MSYKQIKSRARDPAKRAEKRKRQRESGYRGVKKKGAPAVARHNNGRDDGSRDCAKMR